MNPPITTSAIIDNLDEHRVSRGTSTVDVDPEAVEVR
jgi:hypothetical protein